jgi:hypothetical protein
VFRRDCFKPNCATTLFNQRDSADAEAAQFVFEFVASALAAGQSGGEDRAVECRSGWRPDALGAIDFLKCHKDDGAGGAAVGADAHSA